MTRHSVIMLALLALPAAALNAGLGTKPAGVQHAAYSTLFFGDMELLASPFALALVFPASAFQSGRVTGGNTVPRECSCSTTTSQCSQSRKHHRHCGPSADGSR